MLGRKVLVPMWDGFPEAVNCISAHNTVVQMSPVNNSSWKEWVFVWTVLKHWLWITQSEIYYEIRIGGPTRLRPLIFSALNRSSSHRCGFEPRKAKFCLRVDMWFFSGISHFRPTYQLTRLQKSEIILTGRKTQIKKEKEIHIKWYAQTMIMYYV